MNRNELFDALEIAKKCGAEKSRVIFRTGTSSSFSFYNGDIEKVTESSSSVLLLQLFKNSRYGEFSTNKLDIDSVKSLIQKGCDSIDLIAEDSYRVLPSKDLYFKGDSIDLGQEDFAYEKIEAASKKRLVEEIARGGQREDKRVIAINTDYEDSRDSYMIADTNGFYGDAKSTFFSLASEVTVQGEGNARPQGWWSENNIFFDKLALADNCQEKAYQRAVAMLNPKKIKSGKYNVVIENICASKVVRPIITALSGGSIYQKSSFLIDAIGKSVFSKELTIRDIPHTPGSVGSRLFDNEGMATVERDIITDGVVNTYFLNTYFAGLLGMTPTNGSISVPYIAPYGESNKNDIIKNLGKGVLITGFNGGNSNPVTGDFSFGIEGFYFEGGEIIHPIKEMNITGNIISLWKGIAHIGSDFRPTNMWRIPCLAFDKVNLSGL